MSTIIIGTLVFGLIAFLLIRSFRPKKSGGACCSGCQGCSHADICK